MLKAVATPSIASQKFLVRFPAAVNASGRFRRASTSPNTDSTNAATPKANMMSDWTLVKMVDMFPDYGAGPGSQVRRSPRPRPDARSDTNRVDRTDLLPVAEYRSLGKILENLRADRQPSQCGGHDDGPGALAPVGDLEGDAATVGQPHGIDRLGTVLGDQAGHTPDECGDVTSRPAHPLRIGPHRGRHPGFVGALGSGGKAAECPSQAGQGDRKSTRL